MISCSFEHLYITNFTKNLASAINFLQKMDIFTSKHQL